MAKRISKVDNFKALAEGSGIPVGFLINLINLWNAMSPEEQANLIEQEDCF